MLVVDCGLSLLDRARLDVFFWMLFYILWTLSIRAASIISSSPTLHHNVDKSIFQNVKLLHEQHKRNSILDLTTTNCLCNYLWKFNSKAINHHNLMTEWVDCRLLPEQHDQLECTSDKPDLYHKVCSCCLTRGTISIFLAGTFISADFLTL